MNIAELLLLMYFYSLLCLVTSLFSFKYDFVADLLELTLYKV